LPIREDNNRQLNGNGSAMTNGSSSNNNNNNAHNNSNHKNVKLTSDQVKVKTLASNLACFLPVPTECVTELD